MPAVLFKISLTREVQSLGSSKISHRL